MAPHSSTLAWKIPWTEELGGLQSMGSLRVRHDWVISLSLSCIGEGNGNPLQCSCLENPRDSRAWWAAIFGVAQSRTRLKRLSSSSSSSSSDSLEIRGAGVVVGWSYSRKDFKHAKWPVKGYTLNHYHHHHPFVKTWVKHFFYHGSGVLLSPHWGEVRRGQKIRKHA